MLNLRELRRAARIIREELSGGVLRRVTQPGDNELILTVEGSDGKAHILLSCKPEHARICSAEPQESVSIPGSFYQYARAHLVGCAIAGIEASGSDRQIVFRLQSREEQFELIFSILGVRSNIYLLDSGRNLLHAMRPLEDTRRDLNIGGAWSDPGGSAPSDGMDRWEDVADARYLAAIAEAYQLLEQKHRAELLGRRIEQSVKKERTFLDRKAINLQEDLGEARQAKACKRKGELLKNVLHTIRPGDDLVMATDFQTGEMVEIPLDPKLSPAKNLESYFARYQKESRGEDLIRQQLEDLKSAQDRLDEIEQKLKDALRDPLSNISILEELAAQQDVRRLITRYSPRQKPRVSTIKPSEKKEVPTRLLPKRYRTQDGLEIWVGRNDEGNDYLTTRLARGNDLFFHLDGYPGSHVVLRTEGRSDPPGSSILDACELAVHFSRMKNAGSADVHMSPIKNVKKPKGAKAGLVYVRSGKSIRLRHDSKRLQSILASRIE
jgi:predicted ribosome quality control (RQC) complex YloA/Tae2 family protein